ncbi:MAG: hypothetical protein AAF745_07780, partial [Planctomycetota bacterium]
GFGAKMNPANWKMPKPSFRLPNFLVPQDDQNRIVERKSSLVTDVKTTASKSWQRTKELFNPARYNPMNLLTGGAGNSTTPKPNSSPGFFRSLFTPPPAAAPAPESRVAGVNDFLSQERPR